MDGIINVHKEAGFTSHDVVAKLRGILHQKKIGHTGTLDPDATGVLPVCLGKATKVCDLLTNKDKTYIATCRLGVVTDTQDMSGNVLSRHSIDHITESAIKDCVMGFVGTLEQVPPMYSALKVNGKKLYELAREGKTITRKPREITIEQINILQMDLQEGTFVMEVTCSKGTYIRTLCHDIGEKLGCGGAMEKLIRSRVADFALEEALTISEISELVSLDALQEHIISVDSLFPDYAKVQVMGEGVKYLANGNPLKKNMIQLLEGDTKTQKSVLVYDENAHFRGIYEWNGHMYKVTKMF